MSGIDSESKNTPEHVDEYLNSDQIWILRVLAQDASDQVDLYPDFVVIGDELASDWGDAFLPEYSPFKKPWAVADDLMEIDEKLLSFSGEDKFDMWTAQGLKEEPIWDEIRKLSKKALRKRGYSTFKPSKTNDTYVSEMDVEFTGEQRTPIQKILSKILFWRNM